MEMSTLKNPSLTNRKSSKHSNTSMITSSNSLKIYYQNVRGLRSKTNRLHQEATNNDYDMICLTESWLRDGIFNRELFDDRYVVARRDRDHETSSKSDGGGVCVAVKSSSSYTIIHRAEWQCKSVEDLWITIKPSDSSTSIHVACVYCWI